MEQHRRSRHKSAISVFSFDYLFLDDTGDVVDSEEDQRIVAKVLVAHESKSSSVFAHVVPQKGVDYSSSHLAVKLVCEALDRMGYKRVAFRSDGEPSLLAFLTAIKSAWEGEVVPEKSPPGESASNGAAARTR